MGLLAGLGLVWDLKFDSRAMLQLKLLDAYASAMVNVAKEEHDGLGSLAEEGLLLG